MSEIDYSLNGLHELDTDQKTFDEWKSKNRGAQEVFLYFGDQDVTQEDLIGYIDERSQDTKSPLSPFERTLSDEIVKTRSPLLGIEERTKSENRIRNLVNYMQRRREVYRSSTNQRLNLREEQELPFSPNKIWDTTKDVISTSYDGFINSTGPEKALMLSGLVFGILFIKNGFQNLFGGKKMKGFFQSTFGLGILGLGFYQFNNAVENDRGRPFVSLKKGAFFPGTLSKKEWDAHQHAQEIEQTRVSLANMKIPTNVLEKASDGVDDMQKLRFTKGVANLMTMSIEEFQVIYCKYKDDKAVPAYEFPQHPFENNSKFPQYNLSNLECYKIMFDVGQTLGLIDDKGEISEIYPNPQYEQTLLFRALNWDKNIKINPKNPKAGTEVGNTAKGASSESKAKVDATGNNVEVPDAKSKAEIPPTGSDATVPDSRSKAKSGNAVSNAKSADVKSLAEPGDARSNALPGDAKSAAKSPDARSKATSGNVNPDVKFSDTRSKAANGTPGSNVNVPDLKSKATTGTIDSRIRSPKATSNAKLGNTNVRASSGNLEGNANAGNVTSNAETGSTEINAKLSNLKSKATLGNTNNRASTGNVDSNANEGNVDSKNITPKTGSDLKSPNTKSNADLGDVENNAR